MSDLGLDHLKSDLRPVIYQASARHVVVLFSTADSRRLRNRRAEHHLEINRVVPVEIGSSRLTLLLPRTVRDETRKKIARMESYPR